MLFCLNKVAAYMSYCFDQKKIVILQFYFVTDLLFVSLG